MIEGPIYFTIPADIENHKAGQLYKRCLATWLPSSFNVEIITDTELYDIIRENDLDNDFATVCSGRTAAAQPV